MWSLAEALDGKPIIRPLWWIDPFDEKTYNISDQFLIGDQIMVAPVTIQSAVSRDIYIPKGSWINYDTKKAYAGPTLLRNYPVPLNNIPFFVFNNNGTNILKI